MKPTKIRKKYEKLDRQPFNVVGESMTRQAHQDETDINIILSQFIKTGAAAHLERFQGSYGDAPAMTYHEAMNAVLEAREVFQTVPAKIREEFDNDPGKFLEFVQDENNLPRLRELGLAPAARPDPGPVPVRIENPTESEAS